VSPFHLFRLARRGGKRENGTRHARPIPDASLKFNWPGSHSRSLASIRGSTQVFPDAINSKSRPQKQAATLIAVGPLAV
jgi:hypothetical protein